MKTDTFFTKDDEQEIVKAIGIAETNTSGEIRVHIEHTVSIDPYDRAVEVFHELNMNKTKLKNGVLIYIAIKDKRFAICGDEGINKLVEADFWESTKDIMLENFKKNRFKEGIIAGVLRAGERLKTYFPHDNNDVNELSNEISQGI